MKVNITIHYNIEGTRGFQQGEFFIRYNQNVAEVAHEWLEKIRAETGRRKMILEKVIVDNDKDIKEKVLKIDITIPPDNLPF